MSQGKIDASVLHLDDRRREIISLPEREYRIAMFDDIDKSNLKMAERVSGQCNSHFDAVKSMLHEMKISNINSTQQNTKLAEKAIEGNNANLFAIQVLTEELKLHKASLEITAGVERTGKNSVGFIKAIGNYLGAFGAFCKQSFLGIASVIFVIAVIFGRISMHDIGAFFSKILGYS